MRISVKQYVYVAADKTRAFVVLFDADTAEEIESRHFNNAAYPLIDVAHDLSRFVIRAVKRVLDPDEITYSCNVLGAWKLTENGGKYDRETISHRLMCDGRKKRNMLAPSTAEQEIEQSEETSE